LNPAEKIGAKYKRAFSNQFYNSLQDVNDFISNIVIQTTKKEVMNIGAYSHLFLHIIWTI
jgi:hypothetical protein